MFNWIIETLDRKVADGFVTSAHWRCTAVDGEYSATMYGTCDWLNGDITIPYDQLTQDVVLGWVWKNINKEEIETKLISQIDSQKNPVKATGMPWQ